MTIDVRIRGMRIISAKVANRQSAVVSIIAVMFLVLTHSNTVNKNKKDKETPIIGLFSLFKKNIIDKSDHYFVYFIYITVINDGDKI